MPVPENIRKVERPKNTVVVDNGRPGPKQYAVRERKSVKYVAGKNPQPINGKVIGHIIDGKYVPNVEKTAPNGPDMLSYGASALVKSVTRDLFDDLLKVYPAEQAFAIMALATLRVLKPGMGSNRAATHYNRTFVCKDYPGAALSKNSIAKLLQLLGQDGKKRMQFYKLRIDRVMSDHHIAIDSTLKQDSSEVNDLSAFSYKARGKQHRHISILYAYDVELMEPICAEVYPGNHIDVVCCESFIRNHDLKTGLVIADKAFAVSKIRLICKDRPDLHFLIPLKRNDTRIRDNKMLAFEGVLEGVGKHIVYKKAEIRGGSFLYAFKDASLAASEEKAFLAKAEANKDFDPEKYAKQKERFGTIVFESDVDLPPDVIYKCYEERWLLELVFAQYKGDECLDRTSVQGDFSVIGSEFINFIATVAVCRIIRKARDTKLLNEVSYGDLMDDLSSAWRKVDVTTENTGDIPSSDDGCWVHTLPMVFEELETLGLSKPAANSEPKRKGRLKKKANLAKPKRPRGRPRKNHVSENTIGASPGI